MSVSRSVPFTAVPIGVRRPRTMTASGTASPRSLTGHRRYENTILSSRSVSCKKGNAYADQWEFAVVFGGAAASVGDRATAARCERSVVIADLADDKGKELAAELGVPYAHRRHQR